MNFKNLICTSSGGISLKYIRRSIIGNLIALCILLFAFLSSCKKEYINVVKRYELTTDTAFIQLPSGASAKRIILKKNFDDSLQVTLSEGSEKWLSFKLQDSVILLTSIDNETEGQRNAVITIEGKYQRRDLVVKQGVADLNESAENLLTVFKDLSLSEIKEGVNREDVQKLTSLFYKRLALGILDGTYNSAYRVKVYRPFENPKIASDRNKTAKYSLLDNPTGIFVKDPFDEIILFVGNIKNRNIQLHIRNFDKSGSQTETHTLKEGINIFYPSQRGLMYIFNHIDESIPLTLSTAQDKTNADAGSVRINIYSGEINGVFDLNVHDQSDWEETLSRYAKYREIDVLGIQSHIIWPVSGYRQYRPDIVKQTKLFDDLVGQQKDFSGLYKYNKAPGNRMLFRVDYNTDAAWANDFETGYNAGISDRICSEEGFKSGMWVFGHEAGHVNQLRPNIRWDGTVEVTNNLFALYNEKILYGDSKRLVDPPTKDGYTAAFQKIIAVRNYWFLPEEPKNHIPKAAMFWQLYLYIVEIEGQKDFYKDLFEYFRTHDLPSKDFGEYYEGALQMDFVRQVCKTSKINLLDFFEKWGMLKPTIKYLGKSKILLSQNMVDDLKEEIELLNLRKPVIDVATVTDENYKTFIK